MKAPFFFNLTIKALLLVVLRLYQNILFSQDYGYFGKKIGLSGFFQPNLIANLIDKNRIPNDGTWQMSYGSTLTFNHQLNKLKTIGFEFSYANTFSRLSHTFKFREVLYNRTE